MWRRRSARLPDTHADAGSDRFADIRPDIVRRQPEYKTSAAVVSTKGCLCLLPSITGRGVTTTVIDSGINRTTSEFAGRISLWQWSEDFGEGNNSSGLRLRYSKEIS
jgi:subtilisin family serine protease